MPKPISKNRTSLFLGAGAGGNMQILNIENRGPLVLKPGESLICHPNGR